MKRRSLTVITALLLSLNLQAQSLIHVEPAGSLRTLLGEGVNQITNLTLTGTLNGTDVKVLREMANLSTLNLAGANIVTGGDLYYHYGESEHRNATGWYEYRTSNDELGTYAFYHLNKLTSVIVPNSVTRIGVFAFYLCPNLTSVTIGNRVTSIAEFAFASSSQLKTVTVPDNVTSIEGYAFIACTGLTSVDVGNGAASIGTKCFQNCTALTSVRIGDGMTSIGEGAFQNCAGLTEIYVKSLTPPSAGTNCFLNVPVTTCKVHVPEGAVDAYRSAAGWRDFSYIDATAVIPVPLQTDINLYPNPFTSELHLTGAEGYTLRVFSITGVTVYAQKVVQTDEVISLGGIPSGVYFFSFEKDGKVETVKAVKK
jgi:hypothetical protein